MPRATPSQPATPRSRSAFTDASDGPSTAAPASAPSDGPAPFRIDRRGNWFYHGSPIARKAMIGLFASVLRRTADGGYRLETPVERVPVAVEDAPFVAVMMEAGGAGRTQTIDLITNVERRVPVGPAHPLRVAPDTGAGPQPYVALGGGLEARLASSVFYELAERAVAETRDGTQVWGVWSRGAFFILGALDAAPNTE